MANIPTMVQGVLIPPNKNDLKKHIRHRDRHGRQVENLIRLLGKYLEPGVRHPSGREHSPKALVQFYSPEATQSCPWTPGSCHCHFQVMRSCQATKIQSPQAQTNSLRG